MELLTNPLLLIALSILILIYSAILHEIAHGYVADRLGDPTARLMGRLTLDPRPHIDPFLSILIPLLLSVSGSPVIFGGAKPVPLDPFNLKEGRKDIALVSLAGPLTNIVLAIIAAVLYNILFVHTDIAGPAAILEFILVRIGQINVLLAIFNLLPIPPLDGSKVFALILPEKTAESYLALSSIGTFILLFLLLVPLGGFSLQALMTNMYSFVLSLLNLPIF
jgi:Zn-dependent protease